MADRRRVPAFGRRWLWAPLAVGLLGLVACGGSDGPDGQTRVTAPRVPWDRAEAAFAPVPDAPGGGEEPMEPVPVETIAWTDGGYRAAGGDGLRLAVWSSPDGTSWDLLTTLSRACCDRFEQSAQLLPWDDRLLLLTRGERRVDGASGTASFLRVSADDGETWTEVSGGPFGPPGMSADELQVVRGALLVTGRVEDAESRVTNSLWRTTDARHWRELALPGAPSTGFRSIVATPSGVLLARAYADDGSQTWYRSTDDGVSFEQVEGPSRPLSWAFASIGDALLLALEAEGHGEVQLGPTHVSTTDGLTWTPLDRNSGLWGDGLVDAAPAAGTRDSKWFVFERTLREDDGYCFDDVSTCEERQAVLGHITADLVIRTVAVDLELAQYFLVVGDDGSLLLWRPRQGEENEAFQTRIDVLRWAGPEPPALDPEPEPLAPPSDPSEVLGFDVSAVGVGDRFRIRLAVGGCGSGVLEADGRDFRVEEPPEPPYPSSWPFKGENAEDAPSGYVFVEGEHPDADTFTFEIDDATTLVYRHDPDAEPGPSCG